MANLVLFDEFQITVLVKLTTPSVACKLAQRTLGSRRFHARLRRAVADVFRQHTSLKSLKITISR